VKGYCSSYLCTTDSSANKTDHQNFTVNKQIKHAYENVNPLPLVKM